MSIYYPTTVNNTNYYHTYFKKDLPRVKGLTIVDEILFKEEVTASDVLSGNSRLLLDDWGVLLVVSIKKIRICFYHVAISWNS